MRFSFPSHRASACAEPVEERLRYRRESLSRQPHAGFSKTKGDEWSTRCPGGPSPSSARGAPRGSTRISGWRRRIPRGSSRTRSSTDAAALEVDPVRGGMRYGWPESVGGLGGSPMLRDRTRGRLATSGIADPGFFSLIEVLAPTLIDFASAGLAGRRSGPRTAAPAPEMVSRVLGAGTGK